MTLYICKRYKTPMAWAWNVTYLEHTESYAAIHCHGQFIECMSNAIARP
jgi:hypothetical protein